ncbi:MAG: Sir2 family NAD-dependent protein deacetylase [Roseibium sp.]
MKVITSLNEAQDFVSHFGEYTEGSIVALTGAGISTESGIPDFRSPGGIWSTRAPVQYQDFVSDEKSRLEDWNRRFEMLAIFEKAQPNAAHEALYKMSATGCLDLLITQNVDGLHQRSGIPDLGMIELHGNSTYASCLSCGTHADIKTQKVVVDSGNSPRCIECDGLLKAAVVSFGQQMPLEALQEASIAAQTCELFVVLGSSLVVHPAAQLPVLAVQGGAELVILNAEETPLDSLASTVIRTPLAETFEGFAINQG